MPSLEQHRTLSRTIEDQAVVAAPQRRHGLAQEQLVDRGVVTVRRNQQRAALPLPRPEQVPRQAGPVEIDRQRLARRLQQGGGLVEGGALAAKGIQQPPVRRRSKQRVVRQRVVDRGAQIGLAGTHPVSAGGAVITGLHQPLRRRQPRREPRLVVPVRDARARRLHLTKLSSPVRGEPEAERRREFLKQRIVEEQSQAGLVGLRARVWLRVVLMTISQIHP
jgi:hypothetical protein